MCDYSLHGIKNRLAEEGENLLVHRFQTGSKGLTSPNYLKQTEKQRGLIAVLREMTISQPEECAVCIPDGARLLIHSIPPAFQQAHSVCATEVATFRQMSAEAATYRDAVEFVDGRRVRLQDLDEGQKVRVLALSSIEISPSEILEMSLRS